jgi:hypothetical protein
MVVVDAGTATGQVTCNNTQQILRGAAAERPVGSSLARAVQTRRQLTSGIAGRFYEQFLETRKERRAHVPRP